MLKNLNYNLLEEIVQLSKSLYRYDKYIQDAQADSPGCQGCVDLWTKIRERHQEELDLLMEHLRVHINQHVFEFPRVAEMAGAVR